MTLNKEGAQPPATVEPAPVKLKTKQEKANEIALQHLDLPYPAALAKIKELTPCSKAVAHKAYHTAHPKKEKPTPKGQEPTLKVVPETKKQPPFLKEEEIGEITPLEEAEGKAAVPPPPLELQQQDELFRDMFRGLYVQFFSKEGVLGDKYGRTVKACEQLADQQYRWIRRRYSLEQLEQWDTLLLVASYGTFFGGVVKDYLSERAKHKPKVEGEKKP
jgi:hypothetical protein